MLSTVHSAQITGIAVDLIDVETDINRGLHSFAIVGLPDKATLEAKDRIDAAIKNSGFQGLIKGDRKITVLLAPADLKKEGSAFDLAIALGCLLAIEEIAFDSKQRLFLGELALSGELRPIKGAILIAGRAKALGYREIFLPAANVREAAVIEDITVYGCRNLAEVATFLSPDKFPADVGAQTEKARLEPTPVVKSVEPKDEAGDINLQDIRGQHSAKRGLEIAAAGGHNVAMWGAPGTGKSMLAKAFIGILPNLSFDEIIEVTGIHSASGNLESDLVSTPPFRAPHHTSSYVSLVGGGTWPKPGEITLAHRGVLFLDEFPEFEKRVIEALRQPLEDRRITVSRAKSTIVFPANFILLAAMNPCPCGWRSSRVKQCVCTPKDFYKYDRKLSGPIMDRIDLWLEVPPVEHKELAGVGNEESSATVKARVARARQKQAKRFKGQPHLKTNSDLGVRELQSLVPLSENCVRLLAESAKAMSLSARSYHRMIKLARTIADLANADEVHEEHIMEALQYRPKKVGG